MLATQMLPCPVQQHVIFWRSCSDKDVDHSFAAKLPDTYQKGMAFLAAEFGNRSYVYDRCSHCGFVFRAEFQDPEHCPGCFEHRYHQMGSAQAIARLVVCPLSEWVRYLWRHPDLARCANDLKRLVDNYVMHILLT